jgi:hypothetical protein
VNGSGEDTPGRRRKALSREGAGQVGSLGRKVSGGSIRFVPEKGGKLDWKGVVGIELLKDFDC